LRRAQDLLRHPIPDGDPAKIFARALSLSGSASSVTGSHALKVGFQLAKARTIINGR
jgi:hypothetical protein